MKTLTYRGPNPHQSIPWQGKTYFAERGKPCELPEDLAAKLKELYPAVWTGAAPKQTEGGK